MIQRTADTIHPRIDRIGLGLVVALHAGDHDAAAAILLDLDWQQTVDLAVVLALSLDVAWTEACEADGVDFDEFAREAGLWLAQGRPS